MRRRHFMAGMAAVSAVSVVMPAFPQAKAEQRYPNVVAVKVRSAGADTFSFDVTITSPYDTPQRYADAFRIIGRDGVAFGERVLLHDHADEQPFTRDITGVRIPPEVRAVIVQGRDQKYGYGGRTIEVALPGR
jgi:hypothetical protein